LQSAPSYGRSRGAIRITRPRWGAQAGLFLRMLTLLSQNNANKVSLVVYYVPLCRDVQIRWAHISNPQDNRVYLV
jgi:hypothetical protein